MPRFYPTDEESKWAVAQKKAYGGTVILWSLAGSSVHKTWPWLDQVVARLIMNKEDVRIVLVGDKACQMLEVMDEPFNSDPRIIKKSGVWSIRQSLAFAQVADLVVGPETGLLNAVSAEPVPKIVTLSHSSVNNLTRDWINCTSLIPKTACHPCHQLHYSFEFCHQDSVTGVAQCQADIGPNEMYEAITHWIEKCPALAA
jgi:ADP-heptose:LPS heptosyltransferase